MKKNAVVWIVIAVVLIGIIVGASVLYHQLTENYDETDLLAEMTPQSAPDNPAPDITLRDLDGNEVKLSDFRGKPVVINFWATWCYYCTQEMPDFDKAASLYPDVQFLMVNATESAAVAKRYIEQQGYSLDVFTDIDRNAVDAYEVTGYPSTFFIDKNGSLVMGRSGMLSFETLEKGIAMIRE